MKELTSKLVYSDDMAIQQRNVKINSPRLNKYKPQDLKHLNIEIILTVVPKLKYYSWS